MHCLSRMSREWSARTGLPVQHVRLGAGTGAGVLLELVLSTLGWVGAMPVRVLYESKGARICHGRWLDAVLNIVLSTVVGTVLNTVLSTDLSTDLSTAVSTEAWVGRVQSFGCLGWRVRRCSNHYAGCMAPVQV